MDDSPNKCSKCGGSGRILAVDADTYEGETDFCIWCYGSGEEMTDEEIEEHNANRR